MASTVHICVYKCICSFCRILVGEHTATRGEFHELALKTFAQRSTNNDKITSNMYISNTIIMIIYCSQSCTIVKLHIHECSANAMRLNFKATLVN